MNMQRIIGTTILTGLVAIVCRSAINAGNSPPLRLHVMHDDDVARCIRDSGQADDFMEMCYVDNTPMLAISNHGVAKNGPQSRAWRIPGKGWGLGPDHLCASW